MEVSKTEFRVIDPVVEAILIENELDFDIEKEELIGKISGRPTPYFGLFNSISNECLNTVKKSYTPSQNYDILDMVMEGAKLFGDTLTVSKAGSLHGGRKVFIQLAIKGIGLVGNDVVKRFITIIDSNDGSTSLSIGIGDFTMSCSNQFAKFYKSGSTKFRHTATIEEKIKTIPFLLETALNESLTQIELYQSFNKTVATKNDVHAMVKELMDFNRLSSVDVMATKSTNSINKMDKLYSAIGSEMIDKGMNLWGLHSGVTYYTTHDLTAPKRENGKIESVLNGKAYLLNQASLKFCTDKVIKE